MVSRRHSSVRPRRCSRAMAVAPLDLLPGGRASPQDGRTDHRFAGSQVASSSPSPVGRHAAASTSSRGATTAATTRTVRSDGRASDGDGTCPVPLQLVYWTLPQPTINCPSDSPTIASEALVKHDRSSHHPSAFGAMAQIRINGRLVRAEGGQSPEKLGGFLSAPRPTERVAEEFP
jgi:hypothetical protein